MRKQYWSHRSISIPTIFFVGTCTGLYKPVQALKVESLQTMSDFPQVCFHFAQQAMTSPQDNNKKIQKPE
jgi:hypothetical protein